MCEELMLKMLVVSSKDFWNVTPSSTLRYKATLKTCPSPHTLIVLSLEPVRRVLPSFERIMQFTDPQCSRICAIAEPFMTSQMMIVLS